jgi:hypothetical protein
VSQLGPYGIILKATNLHISYYESLHATGYRHLRHTATYGIPSVTAYRLLRHTVTAYRHLQHTVSYGIPPPTAYRHLQHSGTNHSHFAANISTPFCQKYLSLKPNSQLQSSVPHLDSKWLQQWRAAGCVSVLLLVGAAVQSSQLSW